MDKLHNLKIKECFANAIISGSKTFEIRKNDRGYVEGDFIEFSVVNDNGKPIEYEHPITRKRYEIGYIVSGYGLQDGYVVFTISEQHDISNDD